MSMVPFQLAFYENVGGITPPQIDGLFPGTILSGVRVDVGSRAYFELNCDKRRLFTASHKI